MIYKRILSISVAIGIALSSLCFAQEVESYTKTSWKGLDTTTNPTNRDPDSASQMSNFMLDAWGNITERSLFSQYNTTAGSLGANFITGVSKFYSGARTRYFVACAGSVIAKGTSGSWSDITNGAISITPGSYWDAVTFQGFHFMANYSVALQQWNGTAGTTSSVTNAPTTNCRYIELHKSRIWAVNSDSYPNRAYYSRLGTASVIIATNATAFSEAGDAGYIDVAADDGDIILGVMSWGGYLYVFKRNSIYVIVGDSPNEFSVRKTKSQVGCVAPRTITTLREGIGFLGRNNYYIFNGQTSTSISTKIEASIATWENTRKEYASAVFDNKNHLFLAVTEQGKTINNAVYVFDTVLKEWYRYGDEYFSYLCLAEGATDKGEIFGGSSQNDGIVWQLTGASGTESYTHQTKTDLATGTTFNSVFLSSDTDPLTELRMFPGITYSSDLKLFLHCDGAQGSTSIEDLGPSEHVMTCVNDAHVNTTYKHTGTGSILFDGTDSVTSPDSSDWDLCANATDSWTLSCWVRPENITETETLVTQWDSSDNRWWFYLSSTGKPGFYFKDGIAARIDIGSTSALTVNSWSHVALVKVAAEYGIYVNGKQVAYGTDANVKGFGVILTIGNNLSGDGYEGSIDDLVMVKKNIYNAAPVVGVTDIISYNTDFVSNGTLTSDNLQINASGQSTLGQIYWQETVPVATDIQITTRCGATDDSVDFVGWSHWASSSTSISSVSDNYAWLTSGDVTVASHDGQDRNVTTYETYNNVTPNCVAFTVSGLVSKDDYVYTTVPAVDLSGYKWIGCWVKSPTTGNSVKLGFGEADSDEFYATFNTVDVNTWEYHYCPIDGYSDSDLNAITQLRMTYIGDGSGTVFVGEIEALDFYDSGETITSTPNDWIQYRAIMGTTESTVSPYLINADSYVITLDYGTTGTQEASMTSEYYTQYLDMAAPQVNKNFYDCFMLLNASTGSTVYVDYDIDYGTKTGTLEFAYTGEDTPQRILDRFDIGNYGKRIKLRIYESTTASTVSLQQSEIRFRKQPFQPN